MPNAQQHRRATLEHALNILRKYHQTLVPHMAEEIVEERHRFEQVEFGNGDEITEKYAQKLGNLSRVMLELEAALGSSSSVPLAITEFVCPRVELRTRLEDWFRLNPNVVLYGLVPLPEGEGIRCIVLHRGATETTAPPPPG